jgi:hypothetical protein
MSAKPIIDRFPKGGNHNMFWLKTATRTKGVLELVLAATIQISLRR